MTYPFVFEQLGRITISVAIFVLLSPSTYARNNAPSATGYYVKVAGDSVSGSRSSVKSGRQILRRTKLSDTASASEGIGTKRGKVGTFGSLFRKTDREQLPCASTPLAASAALLSSAARSAARNVCSVSENTSVRFTFFATAATTATACFSSHVKNRGENRDVSSRYQRTCGRAEAARRAVTFWRKAGPIVAHYKFTELWLFFTSASRTKRDRVYDELHDRYSPKTMEIILELRGLYVKLGQVLSSRPDFVSRQYVDLFNSLQDAIPPWPATQVKGIARESLRSTQGLDFDDVFESFEDDALGSASIGQVHRAVLKPKYAAAGGYAGGKVVAVKVMHPDAEFRFSNDFRVFKWLCRIALPGWKPILLELERQMMTEFDYNNEAASLEEVRRNMANSVYAKRVKIPEPARELCSKNLLVMEMLDGMKLADAIESKLASALGGNSQLARDVLKVKQNALVLGHGPDSANGKSQSLYQEVKRMTKLATGGGALRQFLTATKLVSLTRQARSTLDLLLDVHGHQIFVNGVFNGDPHPGNILELTCGRLGLIDYGQVRRLSEEERIAISKVVLALGKEDVVEADVANAMRECGFQSKRNRDDILTKTAALFFDSDIAGKELGYMNPQLYLQYLLESDPLTNVPDAAVFVARTSFLFRGMGALLEQQLRTAKRWSSHAMIAFDP